MKKKGLLFASLCIGSLLADIAISDTVAADMTSFTGTCEGCHGKDGASQVPQIPIIGGLSAIYIRDAMAAFREKSRPCTGDSMCLFSKNLSDEDTQRIADYYASKPFVRAKQSFDATLAKRGKDIHDRHCSKCHQEGGSLPEDDAGIMAGQWKPYLQQEFREFKSGTRLMPEKMKPRVDALSEDDIKALVEYFASLQ